MTWIYAVSIDRWIYDMDERMYEFLVVRVGLGEISWICEDESWI